MLGRIGNRFRKSQRLTKPSEYQAVYKSRNWGNNHLFSFNLLSSVADQGFKSVGDLDANQGSPITPKLGVTVSKKVSKKAVVRNRVKRIVREHFRLNQQPLLDALETVDLNKLNDVQIVVTARAPAGKASSTELHQALENLWQKIQKVLPKL